MAFPLLWTFKPQEIIESKGVHNASNLLKHAHLGECVLTFNRKTIQIGPVFGFLYICFKYEFFL